MASFEHYGSTETATGQKFPHDRFADENELRKPVVSYRAIRGFLLCIALFSVGIFQFSWENTSEENGMSLETLSSPPTIKCVNKTDRCETEVGDQKINSLKVSAWNLDYFDTDSARSIYPFFYGEDTAEKLILVEPQRLTNFAVDSQKKGVGISNCSWLLELRNGGGVWDSIPGVTPAKEWKPNGATENETFSLTFPSPGTYTLKISCTLLDNTEEERVEDICCLYVRRELRQLTLTDRNTFLDTFLTMRNTPTLMGAKTYGPHYRSLIDFQVMHVRAAGGRGSDKIHDGLGFMSQHIAMTSEFELAMQSVSPFITIPYWDYTIDSINIETHYRNASYFFDSCELFSPGWFGRTSKTAHTVVEGRMGYLDIPHDYNFTVRSAYGFLRAPWNINPSRYITRYHSMCGVDQVNQIFSNTKEDLSWPSCASHFKMANSDTMSSWYEWAWNISYLPHGPIHAWIGGIGGDCANFDDMYDAGWITDDQLLRIKHNAFIFLKDGWHDFIIETPTYCSADSASASECKWVCADDVSNNSKAQALLREYGAIRGDHPHFEEIARKVFCETAWWPGDHFEAASPSEASFWPMHPTLDRLLQYKDMAIPFKNEDWVISDESTYCRFPAGTTDCKGHHAYDLTFFKTAMKDMSGQYKSKHWTNEEVRNAALPVTSTYMLPYVYNSFEWNHCKEVGVDFMSLVSA